SRDLSERRIFPAIDINASGTRREENLLTAEEIRIMWRLRRMLSGLETQQALELLTSKLKETETNAEFLMLVSKTTLRAQAESWPPDIEPSRSRPWLRDGFLVHTEAIDSRKKKCLNPSILCLTNTQISPRK